MCRVSKKTAHLAWPERIGLVQKPVYLFTRSPKWNLPLAGESNIFGQVQIQIQFKKQ